jgi:hypothetical protein
MRIARGVADGKAPPELIRSGNEGGPEALNALGKPNRLYSETFPCEGTEQRCKAFADLWVGVDDSKTLQASLTC